MENSNLVHESVEKAVMSAVGNAKRFACESIQKTETQIRQTPGKAIAYSVGIGWFLSFLPIGSLIALIVRLVLRLIRPVLFILSVAKIYELAAGCCKGSPTNKT